jgi:hypothetical protein
MLLLILAVVGTPAVVLQVLCVGSACDEGQAVTETAVPFCGLPAALRRDIGAGFREGRSPDVMAATEAPGLVSTELPGNGRVPWPHGPATDTRVPVAFFGRGIDRNQMPSGITLDSIAPTLEVLTGLRREHPEVRTGESIPGLARVNAAGTPLIVVIAWKGVGTPDLERTPRSWPFLRRILRTGAGSLEAMTGSLPLDPAATLTTLGTGALPTSHGITGTLVREDDGDVSRAWSTPEAGSVIATFADDLDRATNERAQVAAIVEDPADRGIIGDGWYLDAARNDTVIETYNVPEGPAGPTRDIAVSLRLGADGITDMLGVVITGPIERVDTETAEVVATIRGLVPGATFVVAGTGSNRTDATIDGAELVSRVESSIGAAAVEAIAADGIFLDRGVMVERSITTDRVADALRRERSLNGGALFLDAYPSFAVAFSRYC